MLSFLRTSFIGLITLLTAACSFAQQRAVMSTIASNGWANNSVNTVIFRKNALVTFNNTQYAAFYDSAKYVVIAKHTIGENNWQVQKTQYQGDAADAHRSISIMIDGAGFLHVAWGQHNNQLNYAKSTAPGALQLGSKQNMVGLKEGRVSYPEFYRLDNGNLLFYYRDGGSGNGSLVINCYDYNSGKWKRLQENLIDGEGKRSAYWQVATDVKGNIHLSWVWRETPDVASNHDMAYACSKDGGKTWLKSTGQAYALPITASNAEYACKISEKSELINQTSMFADANGTPYIATYWRAEGETVPQYQLVFKDKHGWHTRNLKFRTTPFSLSGTGTKRIPVSRPQIIAWKNGKSMAAGLIFRDEERGNKVSIAINNNLAANKWQVSNLTEQQVGSWEPTYDTELWKNKGILSLFIQQTTQIDGEGKANNPPSAVQVLQWKPTTK
ncbi:BNR repeat-containing protein [uncultured Mucilaginibacter sp.]|uniref:BNR repeat-containing protein n=1 Tax=uncultured Mucilaginibacter sp. TaxID=797541 RepID=UPI00260131F0|nr:BNR repeat-containing protein [uncultured Mucilaginibacter sp.]